MLREVQLHLLGGALEIILMVRGSSTIGVQLPSFVLLSGTAVHDPAVALLLPRVRILYQYLLRLISCSVILGQIKPCTLCTRMMQERPALSHRRFPFLALDWLLLLLLSADQASGWLDHSVPAGYAGTLSDGRQLHFHHTGRQEWEWSDNQMILASQYVTDDDELDCKPGILHVDSIHGSGLGLGRQYSTGLMSATTNIVLPSIGGGGYAGGSGGSVTNSSAPQSVTWPGLLNAVPLRQPTGLESCYSSSSPQLMYGGGLGNIANGNNGALGSYYHNNTHQGQMLSMEQRGIHDILKRGLYSGAGDLGNARLGLNLGGRTYFSSEDMGARFHMSGAGKRFRPNLPSMHVPLCQAEGCKADLSMAKPYHRRHKVCEYHSKAATVIITGNTQRFCQQCSRFHALTEFDEGKRSCRKRLADHNRRRRKPQPVTAALPAGDSATPTTTTTSAQGATSNTDNDNPASKKNEDQMVDSKSGTAALALVSNHSDQQGGQQSKEGMAGNKTASSSSTEQPTNSLLSSMTLAPSVSLTLQNGEGRSEMQSNLSTGMAVGSQGHDNDQNEASYTSDRHSLAPYLLNGPSLSLSSNNPASAGVCVVADSLPSSSQQSSPHVAPPNFVEAELCVPWLRGHHADSSPRVGIVQESLGKLYSCHQADEASMVYRSSTNTSSSRRNANVQYFNEHGRMLAEHLQTLHSQVRNPAVQEHQHEIKRENWTLERNVGHEEQTVLSLLETATSNGSRKKESNEYNRQIATMNGEYHHPHHEDANKNGGKHALDFLQQHEQHHAAHTIEGGLHLNTGNPSDMDHEASYAAHSLHCMQVLQRPLSESTLYTTADFIKDGFV